MGEAGPGDTPVVRFRTQNPLGWWWLLGGVNGAIVLLGVWVMISTGLVGLAVLAVLWVITNAILIPICTIALRRRHTIAFEPGVVTPSGKPPLLPADFLRVVHRQRAGRWGIGHEVVLQYRTGEFSLPLDEFARTPESAQRREAVLWLIEHRLAVPPTAIASLSKGPFMAETAIGQVEAARLLLGPIDRHTPNAWSASQG